jgi:hypothetical protein
MTPQPIIKHKETNHIFQQNEDGTFTNLTTGNTGVLTPENAQGKFTIPVMANILVHKNPLVLELIKTLKLELEK